MSGLFSYAQAYSHPLANLNVGRVVTMANMFEFSNFNSPFTLDVRNVEDFHAFLVGSRFNRALVLDTRSATNMARMFGSVVTNDNQSFVFNKPLNFSDTSKVETMAQMFANTPFDQPLDFDVRSVSNMNHMFFGAAAFRRDLSGWNVSSVVSMTDIFVGAVSYNFTLCWNLNDAITAPVPPVYDADRSPCNATSAPTSAPAFDPAVDDIYDAVNAWTSDRASAEAQYGHISLWNVSLIRTMASLFERKSNFNESLQDWDVGEVTDMSRMFAHAEIFNAPLFNNTHKVTNMR